MESSSVSPRPWSTWSSRGWVKQTVSSFWIKRILRVFFSLFLLLSGRPELLQSAPFPSEETECAVGDPDEKCHWTTPEQASTTKAAPSSSSAESLDSLRKAEEELDQECSLYWAPTSLAEAGPSRYGVYTSRSFTSGELLFPWLDVAIQVIDWEMHTSATTTPSSPLTISSNVFWSPSLTNATWEAQQVESLLPGLGMLPQSAPSWLSNIDPAGCHHHSDNGTLHSSSSSLLGELPPETGAWTSYQHCTMIATRDIVAGQELFLASGSQKPSRSQKAGTPVIRSPEWLKQHGRCLDHIRRRMDSSTPREPDQPFRVVASRSLPQGSVVTTSPVLMLPRHLLDMKAVYGQPPMAGGPGPYATLPKQLWLNYCWGHVDSSLLFFPTAPLIHAIPHFQLAQPHSPAPEQPNVALRWASLSSSSSSEETSFWFNQTADQVLQASQASTSTTTTSTTGAFPLVLEVVALTDLAPGDHLWLDYGTTWQEAWDRHLTQWHRLYPPLSSASTTSETPRTTASHWRRQLDQAFSTVPEFPSWVQVRCLLDPAPYQKQVNGRQKTPPNADTVWYEYQEQHLVDDWDYSSPCEIVHIETAVEAAVDGNPSRVTFRVRLWPPPLSDKDPLTFVQVEHVPRQVVTVFDRPYTGPQFHRRAFRHERGLPETLMPPAWRDLAPRDQDQCSLYMAESAIPNSGLGMYTAKAIARDERVFSGEVVIQVEDIAANMKLRNWFYGKFDQRDPDWLLENYYWDSGVTLAGNEADMVESIIPGLGMLANSHTGLYNSLQRAAERTLDFHRGLDVGAGATTDYHNFYYVANTDIEAGAELYVRYGDSWFKHRSDLGKIPMSGDFIKADGLLDKFLDAVDGDTKSKTAQKVFELLKYALADRERLLAALPAQASGVDTIRQIGGTAKASVPLRVRSSDWLEKNGRCLDNIEPKKSRIFQAGRGAFATRALKRGQVIAPLPLVHLRRHHMEVYESDDMDDPQSPVRRIGTQLLINYCYGHPESSLLFFPYSPVVNYLNHNLTEYNAQIQWSSHPMHHADWLQRTPAELDGESHSGLIMEVVATRNIRAGEEVLLNYGLAWELAWEQHQATWQPHSADAAYTSATWLNHRWEWLPTRDEQESSTDHQGRYDTVYTACFVGVFEKTSEKGKFRWAHLTGALDDDDHLYRCQVMEREFVNGSFALLSDKDLKSWEQHALDRKESIAPLDVRYTALVRRNENDDDEEGGEVVLTGIPRWAIRYFDRNYQSDLFLRSAFRHEIQIPDELLPPAWRDLAV